MNTNKVRYIKRYIFKNDILQGIYFNCPILIKIGIKYIFRAFAKKNNQILKIQKTAPKYMYLNSFANVLKIVVQHNLFNPCSKTF